MAIYDNQCYLMVSNTSIFRGFISTQIYLFRCVMLDQTWSKNPKTNSYPWFLSGKEAQVVLSTLSRLMSAKMDETISHVKGWVNGQVEITVTRLYSRVLCRSQVPSHLQTQEPDWDSVLVLILAQ